MIDPLEVEGWLSFAEIVQGIKALLERVYLALDGWLVFGLKAAIKGLRTSQIAIWCVLDA
jgi:hypothetical protein